MNDVTDRQLEILRFVSHFRREHGFPPTIREIGLKMEIASTNGVNDHLHALQRKGCVDRDVAMARSLTITRKGRELLGEGTTLHDAAKDALTLLHLLLDKPLGERFDKVVKQTIAKLNAAGVR